MYEFHMPRASEVRISNGDLVRCLLYLHVPAECVCAACLQLLGSLGLYALLCVCEIMLIFISLSARIKIISKMDKLLG
jgi:hypothetical protein